MIEWALPAILLSAALFPKGKMKDEKKIQILFENRKVCVKRGESLQYPKLKRKIPNDNYTTYIYTLPLGMPSEAFDLLLPALKDGLNKEVEFEFEGVLKMHVYETELPKKWTYDEKLFRPGTWEVPIGKNHKGILYHDFDKYPHLLMGGTTRFGKTVALKGIFNTLLFNNPDDIEFYILDLKAGLEFFKYSALPQVKKVACDVFEAAEVLEGIVKDLKKEEVVFRNNGWTNVVDTPIKKRKVIIVDEGAELSPKIVTGDAVAYAKFCQSALSEISRIGGGIGLRLIYCTQYPTKEAVPMQVKMNIVTRMSFIVPEMIGSKVLLDETGAENLPAIPGRAIYKVEKMRTVQVPYIDDKMMFKMMEDREDELIHPTKNRKSVNDNRPPGNGKNSPSPRNP
jgi:DNA segregation ATPase FtsK/SpoIIIE, S-DNA-T family